MSKTAIRHTELRKLLNARRSELQQDLGGRMRSERAGRAGDVVDELEHTDVANQEDLDLKLLQMRRETVARIDEALRRLDEGEYGTCVECERDIAERRLSAMPFAVRCQACQERREGEERAERRLAVNREAPHSRASY